MVVSEKIGFRKHLPIVWFISKAEMLRLLTMGGCYIRKLPESSTAHQLAEYQNQHMAPMKKRPSFGSVVVLGEDSPEMSLRENWVICAKTYFPICIFTPILNWVQRYAFQNPDRVSEGKNVVYKQHNFEFK